MTITAKELEKKFNDRLAPKNQKLAPGVAQEFLDKWAAEEKDDFYVDMMLKSLGQSIAGNKLKADEKKTVIDADAAYTLLKKINREVV